jgi:hypothetical protein
LGGSENFGRTFLAHRVSEPKAKAARNLGRSLGTPDLRGRNEREKEAGQDWAGAKHVNKLSQQCI